MFDRVLNTPLCHNNFMDTILKIVVSDEYDMKCYENLLIIF